MSPNSSKHPFEVPPKDLIAALDGFVARVFGDITSDFLLMPEGSAFLELEPFQAAYEVLAEETRQFHDFTPAAVFCAMARDARVFGVIRAMLGMSPVEWADLAVAEGGADVDQGAARTMERTSRANPEYVGAMYARYESASEKARLNGRPDPEMPLTLQRLLVMVRAAVRVLSEGAPERAKGVIHRLYKVDTAAGIDSIRSAANGGVSYAALLHERNLGRAFATHRDSVSSLVGDVMESAVERQLKRHGIPYHRTGQAERIEGFPQAPDFFIPDVTGTAVVIEAKITSDDGTARDKVARIKVLAAEAARLVREGKPSYQVVACIDGRGFRVRVEDMRQMLLALGGKVFTTATLAHLVEHTDLRGFATQTPPPEDADEVADGIGE